MAVRIGETYNVVWGKSDDDSDLADILDSGDWLDMRRKMSEIEQDSSSPTSPLHQTNREMPASNSNGPSKKNQKAEANLLCIQEGTAVSDPYHFLPESPESPVLPFHLTATSPVQPPPLTQTKETQTPSDLPAFLLNNTLSDILKQINVISTRQVQIDNMLVKQQQSIDNLTAAVLRQTTTSSVNLSPPHYIYSDRQATRIDMYIIKYKQTTSIPGYAIVFQCIKYYFISDSGNMFTSSTYGSSSSQFRTATNAPVYRH